MQATRNRGIHIIFLKSPGHHSQNHFLPLVISLLTALLGGCGSDQSAATNADQLTAASLGVQTVLAPAEYLATERYSKVNVEQGERLAMQCRACHTLEKGGPHMIGPNLHGIFGRQAGALQNFPYSRSLSGSKFQWTPRALDGLLQSPRDFLPGNSMVYAGLSAAQDRDALIAYLLMATGQ